ncbi:hypothetical protein H4R21_004715 [Coemansia helicoidea]|uniref:Uncharacterized protein n=1 Tax=Coemansia helicoidea TaxID=1286919 RepID=A0ACC1KW77_9FUNG|nr:hypothetical protein H4R21_004715 [Coemansia helicoidea]
MGSMMSILDQVGQVEDARVGRKIQRQHDIKSRTDKHQSQAAERKQKKSNRLEEIKTQLRKRAPPSTVKGRLAKKQPGSAKLKRTLTSVNRDWDAALRSSEPGSKGADADSKAKKRVTFAASG